jgi:KDO2-lipid IV(A) lauroyltransferase
LTVRQDAQVEGKGMSKQRSVVADYGVYLLIRILVCIIQALSPGTARSVVAGLAWLAYRLDKRHRLVAADNLRQAFPGRYDEAELDQLVRAVYQHFCNLLAEIILLPRKLHTNTWKRYVSLKDARRLIECLASGRPVFLVTGHFGNWEMAGYALGLLGYQGHAIARPLDNPFLDDYLRRFREGTGQKVLAKHGDFEQIQAILDAGGTIATLADQDAGQRGLFVDFFGRPASTHKAVALLALEHRVPLVVVGARKVGEPMRYELVVEDVIFPEDYANRATAVRAMTQQFTTALERIIRMAPEQYFWLHRRWRHQPKGRKSKRAA